MHKIKLLYPALLSRIGRKPKLRDKSFPLVKIVLAQSEETETADQGLAFLFSNLSHNAGGIREVGVRSKFR